MRVVPLNRPKKCKKCQIGKIVLSKQKYSIPWPSKILNIHKNFVEVHFFGDGRTGRVNINDVYEFENSIDEIKRCLGIPLYRKCYMKGVREAEYLLGIPESISITNLFQN